MHQSEDIDYYTYQEKTNNRISHQKCKLLGFNDDMIGGDFTHGMIEKTNI
jgi:hypothetical protein